MWKKYFFAHFIFFLFGCAHYEKVEGLPTQGFGQEEKKILQADLLWLSQLKNQFHNPLLLKLSSDLGTLKKADGDCDGGQIACTKLFYPSTLFLNEAFFKMTQSMRVSTLLHERAHHYYRYYTHENCAEKNAEANYNCDVKVESAYGVEVLFYQVLVELFPLNNAYRNEALLVSRFLKNNRE